MNIDKHISLAKVIKKTITNRILACFLILFTIIVVFTALNVINNLSMLKREADDQALNIKNFIISQVLIDNQLGIKTKLDQINTHSSMHFDYIPSEDKFIKNTFHWILPLGWEYTYSVINKLDKTNFGYLRVTGSIWTDKALLYQFIFLISILILFTLTMLFLLYPLANKIPNLLLIKPIDDLLGMLQSKKKNSKRSTPTSHFSEINEIYDEISSLYNIIEKQSKEAAVGQIAEQVIHDIRTPLSALQAFSEQQLYALPEEKRLLAQNAIKQIRDIVNNLDRKHTNSEIEDIQIITLLDEVTSEYDLTNKNISIEKVYDKNAYEYFIKLNAAEITRIFNNIINNSLEAITHNNGKISIKVYANKNFVYIEINDNGCGIKDIDKQDIFDRGFTTKANGSGLGLFHAKSNIKLWSGDIDAKSDKHGTRITITLPKQNPPKWFCPQLNIHKDATIICVDDNELIYKLWQERFNKVSQNNKVVYYKTKDELLRHLGKDNRNQQIYLIDYDLNQSEYNGIDLLDLIKDYKNPDDNLYLVTNQSCRSIKSDCIRKNILIISKSVINRIPICSK